MFVALYCKSVASAQARAAQPLASPGREPLKAAAAKDGSGARWDMESSQQLVDSIPAHRNV